MKTVLKNTSLKLNNHCRGKQLPLFILILSSFTFARGQDKFELVQADKEKEGVCNERKIRKYEGNVEFIKNEVYLYCDSAYVYEGESNLEAFGNIRVIKADAYTLSGDRLSYYGNKNKVFMRGNVLVRRKRDKKREKLKFKLK